VAGYDALAEDFATRLAENLAGRRVLACNGGIETEPATLQQLPAMRRIQDAMPRLRARDRAASETAERASSAIVTALVADLASDPARHVATWPAAGQALGALADLLELLAVDPSRSPEIIPAGRSH